MLLTFEPFCKDADCNLGNFSLIQEDMKAVLSFLLILITFLRGSQGFFSHSSSLNEKIVIGELNEDVILPCSFESGPNIVIHWKNQDYNVHTYYKDSDHLEKQYPRYTNRTSLFHGEIHNGNASLSFRRLSLLDEGSYMCYVATTSIKIISKVVLKVGAFVTPEIKYEKRNTHSFLICGVLHVFPYPVITWQVDNTPVSESNIEEIRDFGSFCIKSRVNITGSNSTYECTIENSLLKQTWSGRWTMKDGLRKMQRENVLLSCELANYLFLPNQDFVVTWSRMKSETFSVLAYFLSSSQNAVNNEPRLLWSKELINQSDFSLTLRDLSPLDSGEYLCNISSSKYTSLTFQTVHVEPSQSIALWIILLSVILMLLVLVMTFYRVKSRRRSYLIAVLSLLMGVLIMKKT
ncbi:HERV-H LTR-associating protein 2 isoform X4 [Pteropus medius]|uniref:HERV-H LTR-associating protein 2 isoform X4 n=1 Tax=Pteropus vampyrus TaxID=132908 RepID=UPI00196ADA72|nr:HERV-H LTR-associating protein 2 isoform X4 [Pteropus giganteus]